MSATGKVVAAGAPPEGAARVVRIRATGALAGFDWSQLWEYRELLYFLTWRDIKVRYQQTALGVAWAVLQPFLSMVIFTLFFGRLAGLDARTGEVPYPVYVYAGLLPWTFFSNAVTNSGNSLVANTSLITKMYFPRLIIPLASVGAGLVDLAFATLVLVAMMLYYGTPLTPGLALVPLFAIGVLVAATGIGALLSALMVRFRDFRYVVPFVLQIWLFSTPVIYPPSIVPAEWRWALAINPMSGLVDGFRAAFLGAPIDWTSAGIALAASILLFGLGATYFRAVERRFADVI